MLVKIFFLKKSFTVADFKYKGTNGCKRAMFLFSNRFFWPNSVRVRENTVAVEAFVRDSATCQSSCASNANCGYYKYFDSADDRQPLMCYHLKSCSRRVIRDRECPLEPNNYIDHNMFTKRTKDCFER